MYLQPHIPIFRLGRDGYRSLFRNPKANGKPNLYESATRTSDCYKHQRFTVLETLRFTSIQLIFDCNYIRGSDARTQKLVADVHEIVQVVEKSTHIRTLAIFVLQIRLGDSHMQSELLTACKDLVSACEKKEVTLVLQYSPDNLKDDCYKREEVTHQPSSSESAGAVYTNFLVAYLHGIAAVFNVTVTQYERGEEPYQDLNQVDIYNNYTVLYRSHLCHSLAALLHPAVHTMSIDRVEPELAPMYLTPGFYHPHTLNKPYELIPECRSCLSTFASREDLRHHLQQYPRHSIQFRRKKWNPISPYGTNKGARVCWTCGYSCNALDRLDAHLDAYSHRRHGIVPRYMEDNAAWDRKWRMHKERRGWL